MKRIPTANPTLPIIIDTYELSDKTEVVVRTGPGEYVSLNALDLPAVIAALQNAADIAAARAALEAALLKRERTSGEVETIDAEINTLEQRIFSLKKKEN